MYKISDDISKNKYERVYLLFGAESYLVRQYRDKITDAMFANRDDMNLSFFDGKDVTFQSIIDLAETLPFFADYRLIVWEDSGLFSSAGEEFAEYLAQMPESTHILFVEKEVDKRSKLYKTVSKFGYAAEFSPLGEDKIKQWLLQIVKANHKTITADALRIFMEKTGSDMGNMRLEMEKLICYALERDSISANDVEAICTTNTVGKIFEMIDALGDKRRQRALDLYYDLIAAKEPPMKILVLIGRHFSQLLTVKDLREKGYDKRRIIEKTEMKSYFADKYISQAAKFEKATIYRALRDCVEADEAVKKGKMTDRLCVETILVKYSG